MNNSTHPILAITGHQLCRRIKGAGVLLLFGYALAGIVQAASPGSDPFPVLDFNDPQKSLIVDLDFTDRFNVNMSSAEVVFERAHGVAGDPPLLKVEVFDLDGDIIETFNAWHPLWAFVEDDSGNESRVILPQGAVGRVICPFRPDAAEMVISDVAAEQEVISINLLPITHPFCRDNPDDPDCIGIANRPPVCIATVPPQTECTGATTRVTLDGTGSFDPDEDPIVSYDWSGPFVEGTASGETPTVTFTGVGDFNVNLDVTDDWGGASMCSASVTVEDTIPPELDLVVVSPNVLWPPNHKLVTIQAAITVSDVCDATPSVRLVSITSNEPDNGLGDGDAPDDIQGAEFGTDDREFQLRAERSGLGDGRIYTITYQAIDASGNTAERQATVTVPQMRGRP